MKIEFKKLFISSAILLIFCSGNNFPFITKNFITITMKKLFIKTSFFFFLQGPPQPAQPFKFTVVESCDRIKEEFNFLQAQYHK